MTTFTPEETTRYENFLALQALEESLKPCPFCGGPAELLSSIDGKFDLATCEDRDCTGRSSAMKAGGAKAAAARWNKRANL